MESQGMHEQARMWRNLVKDERTTKHLQMVSNIKNATNKAKAGYLSSELEQARATAARLERELTKERSAHTHDVKSLTRQLAESEAKGEKLTAKLAEYMVRRCNLDPGLQAPEFQKYTT